MATVSARELGAPKAILGLIWERPDTVAGLGTRLEERYPGAAWPRSILHNTLGRLVKQGLVLMSERGASPAWHFCELTPLGVSRFEEWLEESTELPPPMRDPLLAKLRHVEGSRQYAARIADLKRRELLTRADLDGALARYRRAQALGELTPAGDEDLKTFAIGAAMMIEVRELQARIKSYQRARGYLEDPLGDGDALSDA